MARKVSELDELINLSGDEEIYISKEGGDYKSKIRRISQLVSKAGIGLDKVDNTADLDKPVSNATLEALARKSDTNHTHQISEVEGLTDNLLSLQQAINSKPSALALATKVNNSDLPAKVTQIVTDMAITGDVSVGALDW